MNENEDFATSRLTLKKILKVILKAEGKKCRK